MVRAIQLPGGEYYVVFSNSKIEHIVRYIGEKVGAIPVSIIRTPESLIGKRIRLKIEVVGEDKKQKETVKGEK